MSFRFIISFYFIRESVLQLLTSKKGNTSAYTHILPFSLVFVTRAKYAFGLLGGNVQKPYFSVLNNGFGLLAGKYGNKKI